MRKRFVPIMMLAGVTAAAAAARDGGLAYADYAVVLEKHVDSDGFVDYSALSENRDALDRFVASMGALDRGQFEKWDERERIAFWINAYNALTLALIIDNYPIESSMLRSIVWPKNSIRQIPGAWTEVTFTVMGEAVTLDHIEHEILRAEFDEPRIHMALVCAARSCPNLRREPYRGDVLDRQLDDQSRIFLADEDNFFIDRDNDKVHISAIFDWFKGDFVSRYGGERRAGMDEKEMAVINFVADHVDESDRGYLLSGGFDIVYIEYDWTLNER